MLFRQCRKICGVANRSHFQVKPEWWWTLPGQLLIMSPKMERKRKQMIRSSITSIREPQGWPWLGEMVKTWIMKNWTCSRRNSRKEGTWTWDGHSWRRSKERLRKMEREATAHVQSATTYPTLPEPTSWPPEGNQPKLPKFISKRSHHSYRWIHSWQSRSCTTPRSPPAGPDEFNARLGPEVHREASCYGKPGLN